MNSDWYIIHWGDLEMTELYIVRHCEAEGNILKTFQGITDYDITNRGEKQLALLAERFKYIKPDIIYSSPLKRAYKTAEAINKYHKLPIIINKKLIEIDGGEIEGISWVDFPETRPETEYYWSMEPHKFHVKGGEPMTSVYKRAGEVLEEIVAENEGKTVVIASHGCTIRAMMCIAMGKPIEELGTVNFGDNTGVFLLRFGGSKLPEIAMFNDTSHLSEELLPKENKIQQIIMEKPEGLQ